MSGQSEEGCGRWVVISLAWLLIWYFALNASYQEETQGLQSCGWLDIKCHGEWGRASNSFGSGMLLAIVTIPLPIIAFGWVGRFLSGGAEAVIEHQERRKNEQRDRESKQAVALIGQQAQAAKTKLERGEFIQSLGAASDFLDIFPFETDSSRILQIRQGISKELRDILATYTLDQMVQILREDDALRIKLKSMLASLDEAKIPSSDADVLREALARATR